MKTAGSFALAAAALAGIFVTGCKGGDGVSGGANIVLEGLDKGEFREARPQTIRPLGWIAEFLERQRDGLGLHHSESGYPYDTCLWAGEIPKGWPAWGENWWPYEQTAYLVDGLARVSIFLGGDKALWDEVRPSLDAPLPEAVVTNTLWPLGVFERAVIARDGSAKAFSGLYRGLPRGTLPGCCRSRELSIIEGMCRTGERDLVRKAEEYWHGLSDVSNACYKWESTLFSRDRMMRGAVGGIHGVTASEIGKLPAILYLATGNRRYLDASLAFFEGVVKDHMLVDGAPAAAEGLYEPASNSEHETCTINDMMWSWGYLLEATGDGVWGDRVERALFNAGFGALSKDFKSFQYFSSPNQAFATDKSTNAHFPKHWSWITRQAYRPGNDTECCAGNVHRLIPSYVARMWMIARDGGPVAALYGPSRFDFAPGESVEEKTDYPFDGKVTFVFHMKAPRKFAFRYRVPGWAGADGGKFRAEKRVWSDGDEFTVDFPMAARIEKVSNGGADAPGVAVVRGPLVFTPEISEKVETVTSGFKCSEAFPAYNITAGSAWSWALVEDAPLQVSDGIVGDFPWDTGASPVSIGVKCVAIPEDSWTWGEENWKTPQLPKAVSAEAAKAETVKFVPVGTTRMRMAVLPAVVK